MGTSATPYNGENSIAPCISFSSKLEFEAVAEALLAFGNLNDERGRACYAVAERMCPGIVDAGDRVDEVIANRAEAL